MVYRTTEDTLVWAAANEGNVDWDGPYKRGKAAGQGKNDDR